MHNLREAYRRMYDALDIKNIDAILPEPPQPAPIDPATENGNALKGMPLQAFPEQDHEAHVWHTSFLGKSSITSKSTRVFDVTCTCARSHRYDGS